MTAELECGTPADFDRAVATVRQRGGKTFETWEDRSRARVGVYCPEVDVVIFFGVATVKRRAAVEGMETRAGRQLVARCLTHGHPPAEAPACELCLAASVLET